jgi:hypothetical protein
MDNLSPLHLQYVFQGLVWIMALLSGALVLVRPGRHKAVQPRVAVGVDAGPPEILIERPGAAGIPPRTERLVLRSPEVLIGRSSMAGLVVDDEFVSSRHAILRHSNQQLTIEDLDSTNGTFLNSMPLQGTASLKTGDLVQIGKTTLRVL